MAICRNISKLLLIVINLSLLLASGVLISLGGWMFVKYTDYRPVVWTLDSALMPSIILLAVGGLGVLLAVIGFVATCKEHKCVLGIYFSLLLFILTGMIVGSVLAYVYSMSIEQELHRVMSHALDEYNSDGSMRADVDAFQSEFQCCGVDNFTDWLDTPWYNNETTKYPYPESCCHNMTCFYSTNDTELYSEGCYEKLGKSMKHHLIVIASVAGAFALIILIGQICSCVLIIIRRRQPEEIRYTGIGQSDGMRI